MGRGGGGVWRYPIPQEKLANTMWKIDEIPIPHLDPPVISHPYLHPFSVFIYHNLFLLTY